MQPASGTGRRAAALALLKTAMIEKKLTQAELADAADCHEKTVQNLLAGRTVREQTLFDVCMVLGLDYDKLKVGWAAGGRGGPVPVGGEIPAAAASHVPGSGGNGGDIAPVYMGAYTRAGVDQYLGSWLTLRPAFSNPGRLFAYRTDIVWDPDWPSLLFQERERSDAIYSHRGRLYIPASSMFIHLVSLTKGAMRMVLVSQLDQAGQMRGIISTLHRRGAVATPVAAPIVYVRQEHFDADTFGEIGPEAPSFQRYRDLLERSITDGYSRLIGLAN